MDLTRFGGDVRLLRRRRGWTQARLASEAGVSRWVVAEVEGGRGAGQPIERLARVSVALGAYLNIRLQFRGEGLDRLRDRQHAALVERFVRRLVTAGWEVATEVSFNHYGERGSIDILAFHAASRVLLVIEVKTVVPDVGAMLATLDRKVRLAPEMALARGWDVDSIARLLVLPEDRTARRRIAVHESTFAVGFPARNVEVNRFVRAPSGSLSGLIFLPPAAGSGSLRSSGSRRRTMSP